MLIQRRLSPTGGASLMAAALTRPHRPRKDLTALLQLFVSGEANQASLQQAHAQVVASGLRHDTFLGNLLLGGYSRCGCLEDAQTLFDGMLQRNLVSWSTLISMYTQHNRPAEAPREFILGSVLRACVQLLPDDHAPVIHGFVVKSGFGSDVYVGTALVNYYSKAGLMDAAASMFEQLPERNSVTWTTIISGYSQAGRTSVSLELFKKMMASGASPDRFVLSSVLSACSSSGFLEGGKQVHGFVFRAGAELDDSVSNVLIDLYSKCSRSGTARKVFDQMTHKNIVSWTTMIAGYMQNQLDLEAVAFVMTSCGSLMALRHGEQAHAYAAKSGLTDDEFVKNGLVDMYAKCGALADAKRAFDTIPWKNAVSFNAMIEGLAGAGELTAAAELFARMRRESLSPTLLTFLQLSRQIHALTVKHGVSLELFSGSALISVYSKCSCADDARSIFEEMEERTLWLERHDCLLRAERAGGGGPFALPELRLRGPPPEGFTFVSLLAAAGNLARPVHGMQFHGQILKEGLESDAHVANALIDTYAKCGEILDARKVFDGMPHRDVVCWNSMISKYAQHGHAEEALAVFREMVAAGWSPRTSPSSACSPPGDGALRLRGRPAGRAGRLREAREFIEQMPVEPAAVVWRTLLGACQLFGDVDLGRHAAKMSLSENPGDSGSYILLSNILASNDMWVDVEKLREGMDLDGVAKKPGYSWI
ncbi:unnamed protein product [Spirodela intermedia]|uniref:Uncharacterized protein n=1 Tax=Spirodela intermedia TaxID=51605 RepID=A0A7I8J508_SPIIN|nr:unnamed protein product [Spirodela intermedia]CAA6665130.1 unnamed protein product [Spirodela intermedia]